jgi:regulator of replication initiation timing
MPWIEVFKTGKHTSSNGVTKEWTDKDLQKIAETYNAQTERKAPLVIGHPAHDDPAFGWVDELKVAKDKLFAFVSDINQSVKDAVNRKEYQNVSIALWANGLLRHIGLLGAAAPAVPGLTPVAFADDQQFDEFASPFLMFQEGETFSKDDRSALFNWISRLRKSLTNLGGKEVAETVFPRKEMEQFGIPVDTEENTMDMKELEEKVTELSTQFAALSASHDTLTKENATLAEANKTLTQTLADTREAMTSLFKQSGSSAFTAFCDRMVAAGKIVDGEKEALTKQYELLQKAEAGMQFAAGEKTMTQTFMESIEARPSTAPQKKIFAKQEDAAKFDPAKVPVEFTAFADGGLDTSGLALEEEIEKYMADHKDVSYEQAFSAVVGG